mgnify:CR=1 FL=1
MLTPIVLCYLVFQWTLMKFMIDGGSHSPLPKARKWLRMYPEASRELLQMLCELVVDYLVGQVKAGAQVGRNCETFSSEQQPSNTGQNIFLKIFKFLYIF